MLKKISIMLVACMMLGMVFASCQSVPPKESESESDETTLAPTDESAETEKEKESETEPATETEEPMKKKSIDIYIIAGQSNGVGHTKYDTTVLSKLWRAYKMGNSNVIYSGRSEYTINVNTPEVSTGVNEFQTWVPARAGMGKTENHMGAEVGMASYLSKNYYTSEDNKAGIIKFGHGGTSLLNSLGGENAASGNWVSPSYAKSLGVEYSGLTGGLYRGLLLQIEKSVKMLEMMGYDEVNIKGVFWMQGESDMSKPDEYAKAFKYFVDDLRKDIGELMEDDLSELPIMVGEISRTSGSASESSIARNEKFIAMQRGLAENIDNVYVIASGQYEINWLDGNGNNTNGQDSWHWTTEHMYNIGVLVGECIVNNILGPQEEAE